MRNRLSALGTGAGFLRHRLHLSSPDAQVRSAALTFAGCIVDQAGELGAPAIVGSLKGSIEPAVGLHDVGALVPGGSASTIEGWGCAACKRIEGAA